MFDFIDKTRVKLATSNFDKKHDINNLPVLSETEEHYMKYVMAGLFCMWKDEGVDTNNYELSSEVFVTTRGLFCNGNMRKWIQKVKQYDQIQGDKLDHQRELVFIMIAKSNGLQLHHFFESEQ
ncbi:TPA: hypothetical protein NJ504_004640 [Vibrio parahaemolyticus]|uniref:hypothetical protein n=1 Tax=Vibrio parahaemolyticus TaxID=670 RepID=UPI001E57EDBF|nr:hypothetical protein [Vibrio parahaemolyticus]HCG8217665.1 hypothetical protein [Vibrio parahaemolyticus]HCM0852020.1 hypothetical protein [Vibrio parahaemolyticus]HCM1039043.1 hypothetical protein [Vibrio parahaemolyticus]